ncbi:MAG: (Fe-S)-binding protein [Candidatus Helarchaeota archaeon]
MFNILEEIEKCIQCHTCELACPSFTITQREVDTPHERLQIARKILMHKKITPEEYASIYNCPKCEKCEVTCPSEIKISNVVGKAREELFSQGYELLPGHQSLRDGILQRKNSVKGDPTQLLNYLPESVDLDETASTIFYAGCLPGYFLKEIGRSSVQLLQKIGIPFRVLSDEICCGSPLMDLGDVENAKKFFTENLEMFQQKGVKELIVACSGCYRSFREFYPEVLGKTIKVRHIIEVIAEAIKKGKLQFKKLNKKIIYHDPCHLSREFGMYEEPRLVLKQITNELIEFINTRQAADCCGANSAVRAGFKDLSVQVALRRIDAAGNTADILTTSCPFCTFNLNYACRKNNRDIEIQFITNILMDALEVNGKF